jgi:hypothetical protein
MPPARAAHGRLPEWPKGAVCKTVGSAYVGSNPTPATTSENCPRPLVMWSGAVLVTSRPMQPDAARSDRMPLVAGYTWDGFRRSGSRNEHDLPDATCSHRAPEPGPVSAVKAAPAAPLARRQRRALALGARPPHAGPQTHTAHQRQLLRHADASNAQPPASRPIVQLAVTASMPPAVLL